METKRLKSLFIYEDGELYRRFAGGRLKKVGCVRADGYRIVRADNKQYYLHRLIYQYFNGCLPEIVDHINRDHTDNRIENLRPATQSQNLSNSTKSSCPSGIKGVFWKKSSNRWISSIKFDGRSIHLATTDDFFEACCQRISAENRLLGEFSPRR